MEQTYINWGLGLLTGMFGFLLNVIWRAVRDLQTTDKELTSKLGAIEVLVAGDYVTRREFESKLDKMFSKLDAIEAKIDRSRTL